MGKLKNKIKSDSAAALSAEMLLLIAMSLFIVIALIKYIVGPMVKSSEAIGKEIENMSPNR